MKQHLATAKRMMAADALAEKQKHTQDTALKGTRHGLDVAEATAAFYYLKANGVAVLQGDDTKQHLATAKRMMAADALAEKEKQKQKLI